MNLTNNNSEIDLLIKPTETRSGLIREFKYDRKAKSSLNKTNRYGKLINDLLRLSLLTDYSPNYESILVYVSDVEMIKYKNGFYVNQTQDIDFELTNLFISELKDSAKQQVNAIFLNPFVSKNLKANCKLIFKQIINEEGRQYGIYAWKVNSSQQPVSELR